MKERAKLFLAFFVKTFCVMNFVVGSMAYVFVPNKLNPVPEPSTMVVICLVTLIMGVMADARNRQWAGTEPE